MATTIGVTATSTEPIASGPAAAPKGAAGRRASLIVGGNVARRGAATGAPPHPIARL